MGAVQRIAAEVKRLGFVWFESGDYNLNLIGLRAPSDMPNAFDDALLVVYKVGGVWKAQRFPLTTDPGTAWLAKPMRETGCAIVALGQYRGVWGFGLHRGKYEALVQVGEFRVWRDNDKDAMLDRTGPTYPTTGSGINLHKAGTDSPAVNDWSAGCQVFKRSADFETFMALAHRQQVAGRGATFTYTLIDVGDNPALADLLALGNQMDP